MGHTATSEAPPPCNGHPRNGAGFVLGGFPQCEGPPGHELQWCVGTPTDIDNCDAAMHAGRITSGRPQLADDQCVGSDLDRQNCYAARRHMTRDAYLASLRVVVADLAYTQAGFVPRNATEACIFARENGGDFGRSSNPTHFGAFQYDFDTWVSNGGSPSTWGSASPAEQIAVFRRTVDASGYAPWTPWNHC